MVYLIFNPPQFALGANDPGSKPEPALWYFMLIPSILLIGQGAF